MSLRGRKSSTTWKVGQVVLVFAIPAGVNRALVMERDPQRRHIVKVKYLHSNTAAWIDERRIKGLAAAQ